MIAPSVAELNFFSGGKRKFLRKNGKIVRNARQCHLNNNNKSHNVRYDIFNSTYIRIFLYKSKKLHLSIRFYDLDHVSRTTRTTITTQTTTGYLQNFQDGLQILAVRGFRNRSKKFFKKSLMPAFIFMFLRTCEDFSYKSSSMKSVRAAITFVSFARHHTVTTKHL